ncbi:MAG: lipase family protein [Gammaproteobacteria bacterium]|nr:lipase family protein [Gammaproteobacteria bacterium]
MITRTAAQLAADAELAFLALYAEDAFSAARSAAQADLTTVAPDPRLASDWDVRATLTAVDDVPGIGRADVFYGWLLEHAGRFVLAIRGTADAEEWILDGEFWPRGARGIPGTVETGFWSVAETLKIDGKPLAELVGIVNGPITVVGHSLGAALATYAAYELARAGMTVSARMIASPHPGDGTFAAAFGSAVPDHVAYVNTDDLVPDVPGLFSYTHVPNVVNLDPAALGVELNGGPAGDHHVLSYVAMMSRPTFAAFKPLPIDQKFVDCVKFA